MTLLFVALTLLAAAVPAGALTVRVDAAGGAPRLLVDGRPVRARMFWGAPGTTPIPLSPAGEVITREFTAVESEPDHATMHLRFQKVPGEILLDDIQLTEVETGRQVIPRCDFESGPGAFARDWTFWPTGAQNTVGSVDVVPGRGRGGSAALRIRLQAPPDGRWPDFHIYHIANLALVKGRQYRLSFWARAEPAQKVTIACYRPGQTFVALGGPGDCFASQIRLAAGAGVDFVSFPCSLPWPAPGEPADWSGPDAQCERVLAANPKALLIPRIGVEPPAWWQKAHPDEMMRWEDAGQHRQCAVPASPLYRHDAAERLAALVAHLEEKLGDHIAGYHTCGQNTGEWFYEDTWGHALNGYAPADLAGWRAWLHQHYATDEALRGAWDDAAATLAGATVPSPAARHAAPAGILRDPAAERPLIDFAAYQQDAMAGCVLDLARAVRQASGGRKLVLFFYGYGFEFGAIQNGPATSGHYAFRRILNSPDIDVLCSPISYFDRGPAGSAPAMSAAESVALAGKMWLNEDDTATYLSTGQAPGWMERARDLQETNAELARNVAQESLRHFGTWWMDLGATGWFDDPGIWDQMKRLQPLDDATLAAGKPFRPEVAAVLDEGSMLRVAAGGTRVTRPGVYEARAALGRMGAPYGQYLLDDVAAGKVDARLYVFLNAWCLTAEQRRALREHTRGRACIWCYAPGYQDGYRTSLDAMRELTGFRLAPVAPAGALAAPTDAGKRLGLQTPFGAKEPVRPLFAATDARPDEVLATYADGSAAVALRRTPEGVSIFAGAPGLTSELLRVAARAAGVHLFTDTDCCITANAPFLALHATQDGPVVLDTGRRGPVTDVPAGEQVGQGPRLTLTLKRGETRVLRY